MHAFDLDAFLPYRLAKLASRVSRGFAQEYSARFGLSIPEWRVMAHLSQSDTVSVREGGSGEIQGLARRRPA